jgi:hypothetical protein
MVLFKSSKSSLEVEEESHEMKRRRAMRGREESVADRS